MLAAKLAPPVTLYKALSCFPSSPDRKAPVILFSAPPGYLMTECLAETFHETRRGTLWVRLESLDCEPATFLLALIDAAQQLQPDLGNYTLQKMRAQPGPIYGWPALFACLGEEISQGLDTPAAIVIERFHHLYDQEQVLALFKSHFLPALHPQIVTVLISHVLTEKAGLPPHTRVIKPAELRLEETAGLALARQYAPNLPPGTVRRAMRISDRRPGILVGLLCANAVLGPERIAKTVSSANNTKQLLSVLARDCLAADNAVSPQILALALQVEYLNQDLTHTIWGELIQADRPWFQSLANQWVRMRSLWRGTLVSALHIPVNVNKRILQRAAEYFLQTGQTQEAISLYFESGDFMSAAAALSSVCEMMMDLGQWTRLKHWIEQFPQDILHEWPWLAYSAGEIEAAEGELLAARQRFRIAADGFTRHARTEGVCQSLLAESTLASWQNDAERAYSSALIAYQLAQGAGLSQLQGWAGWQLGHLASHGNRPQEAAVYFRQSAAALQETGFADRVSQAAILTERQVQLVQQRWHHQQALHETENALRDTATRLEQLTGSAAEHTGAGLVEQGWSQIPLMVKLAPVHSPAIAMPETHRGKIAERLHQILHTRLKGQRGPAEQVPSIGILPVLPPPEVFPLPPGPPAPLVTVRSTNNPAPASSVTQPAPQSAPQADPKDTTPPAPDLIFRTPEPQGSGESSPGGKLMPLVESFPAPEGLPHSDSPGTLSNLAVYCLGTFRVFHHNRSVENWGSKKAQQIFKYLIFHHKYPTPKEVLMDTFWPEADPEAARRNLHQAVYVLRQALKTELDLHCIRFENDCYRIHVDDALWVDHLEFERHVKAGQRLEKAGQVEQAMSEYSIAIGLYQDDFLVEDIYEDWPKSRREFLWQLYLLTAQQMAEYYLDRHEYTTAMALSRRILARDQTQEPAHQILIRAYLGQGLRHMALRQYKNCIQILKQELSLPPAPNTQALYQQILKAG